MTAFKDSYSPETNAFLANIIDTHAKKHFNKVHFLEMANDSILHLELKARVKLIATALRHSLPADYCHALEILIAVAQDTPKENNGKNAFRFWPFLQFIEEFGLEHFDFSLKAMHKLTSFFTAEFAIRPYIIHNRKRVFDFLEKWVHDPSEHVRRLVSEGSRPRLPWGIALPELIENPNLTIHFLDILKSDSSEYVRRSVSNHMNDFSRNFPDHVVQHCSSWWTDAPERQKLVKHALRTCLKKGNKDALKILGFGIPKFENPHLILKSNTIKFGNPVQFTLQISAPKNQNWMIDYAIHHQKANGKRSAKIFKWSTRKVKKDTEISISKKHKFIPVTTRKYYPGEHEIEVFINGESVGKAVFELKM